MVSPIVLHLITCEDVDANPDQPDAIDIKCVQGNIVSLSDPPYPFRKEALCVFALLTEVRGNGRGQIRVAIIDEYGGEVLLFGSPERVIDNPGGSPVDFRGFIFRILNCPFPRSGDYMVQFWYNGAKLDQRPIFLK